ncbi:MlaD family protein [Polaribacter gangjinensis]|uniref:ABC transporter substrate-binding protein n=1 Tax=Polaribacter gangjinensis TaxID=574710 RepID=A0A2S7W9X5_9FLAO|nr:MlaD family protein [Polaribacter gangjinensis]PQJ74216.1 ABC transporter substrate-binding protein [Polaribacter gangjinensis]
MSRELKTGIIAILIIIIFIWGFNFLNGQNIFQPSKRQFLVEYNNVGGLTEASSVFVNGLKVGGVDNIDFNPDPAKKGQMLVKFSLENGFIFTKKSIVKIYSPNPLSGSNLVLIPSYEGEEAKDGDYLQGEVEEGLFSAIGARLDPIQIKLERVLESADLSFKKFNNLLDKKTTTSIQNSFEEIEFAIIDLRTTIASVNSIVDSNSSNLKETLKNTNQITQNLSKVTDTLVNSNLGEIMRKAELTLTSVNSLLDGIQNGKGTAGKLMNDDALYTNLTEMSQELEELLRDMKLNPKRFVHFSLFGKKPSPYKPEVKKEEIKQ